MLKSVHVQQVPGMRFSACNNLFSIVKGAQETLPAVASRVEEAIVCVIKLRPKQVTEVSTSPDGFTQTTRDYTIGDLDKPARPTRTLMRTGSQTRVLLLI
jgi:hypothetical protein